MMITVTIMVNGEVEQRNVKCTNRELKVITEMKRLKNSYMDDILSLNERLKTAIVDDDIFMIDSLNVDIERKWNYFFGASINLSVFYDVLGGVK